MKIVNAFVKPHKLSPVVEALHQIQGLTGVTVMHTHGFGRTQTTTDEERSDELGLLTPNGRLEVVCRDALVSEVVRVIETTAHTGLRGDGKIFVTAVEEVVRIATGTRGEDAV